MALILLEIHQLTVHLLRQVVTNLATLEFLSLRFSQHNLIDLLPILVQQIFFVFEVLAGYQLIEKISKRILTISSRVSGFEFLGPIL